MFAGHSWVYFYADKTEVKCKLQLSHYHKYWAFADDFKTDGEVDEGEGEMTLDNDGEATITEV